MIVNVLFELKRRGHHLKIFSRLTDRKSIRMFDALSIPVHHIKELKDSDIKWSDTILSALRAHIYAGDKLFCSKYIFVYNNYIDSHWATPGADFMFTCGNSRHPIHPEDCASMPIGCPKNDHLSPVLPSSANNNFLFIDSGHYPFSHTGKMQVVDMLLNICKKFPDYKLTIKPRFLLNDTNTLHTNHDHIYTLLNERCDGKLPENLKLLDQHLDLQELVDQSCCVIMLCSSAYIDVALRGKNMIIVKGLDNEDKFELRNEIEYKNIYELREKSGCVVNYKDVVKYLPHGLHCSESHLDEVVAHRTDASKRMVDVMEWIINNYIKKGKFPAINNYNFNNYKQDIQIDEKLNWKIIKQKRLKNLGNNLSNLFLQRITADIDFKFFFNAVDNEYMKFPLSMQGINDFTTYLKKVLNKLLIDSWEKLMDDPLNQAELFRAYYEMEMFQTILNTAPSKILCRGPYHYYVGNYLAKIGDRHGMIYHLIQYLKEANSRSFEKYSCEMPIPLKNAYCKLINAYDGKNILDTDLYLLHKKLYEKSNQKLIPFKELNKLNSIMPKIYQELLCNGKYEIAAEGMLIYIQKNCQLTRSYKEIKELKRQIANIKASKTYKIGILFTFLPRKIRKAICCLKEHGWKYTYELVFSKIKNRIKHNSLYAIWNHFKNDILSGFKEYQTNMFQFGENTYLEVGASGTGDVFISGLYYKKYLALNNREENAIYVLPGKSCCKTIELFDVSHTVQVDREAWMSLLHLYRFMGEKCVRIDVLYYHIFTIYTGCLTWLESYKGWNLYSLIHAVHFSQIPITEIQKPIFSKDQTKLERIFDENKLIPGKTVILAPYAKWPPKISMLFWENLTQRLISKGFTVCTNSIGSEEPAIVGSTPIFYPYELSVPFVEKAGYIVGLRSGFLDIIESAKCKKVALYPYDCRQRGIANGTAMGSFSLNAMYKRNDWLEIETLPQDNITLIDTIINYFTAG